VRASSLLAVVVAGFAFCYSVLLLLQLTAAS
jgi:hypothetical protein